MQNETSELVGKQIRFQFSHVLQMVNCKLTIVSVRDGVVRARVPSRVMALPFPPAGKGNNILLFKESDVRGMLSFPPLLPLLREGNGR
jgi:hypothetical protein